MAIARASKVVRADELHSKFIPEADRGWTSIDNEKERMRSSTSRRSSAFLNFGSLWLSPKDKIKFNEADDDNTAVEDEDNDPERDEEEEEQIQRRPGRERSNSMPSSIMSDDSRSFFSAGQDLERTFSQSSSIKRRSVQMPPDPYDHAHQMNDIGLPLRPSVLSRHNSKAPALSERQVSSGSQQVSRGYPWRRTSESGKASDTSGFIHPSHRNPTGSQAFYDTHFGSSSGWRSVAGMADEVFHPFENAKYVLGKWSGSKRERKSRESEGKSNKALEERKKESLLGWTSLNSLGIFGMSNFRGHNEKSSGTGSTGKTAYEAELIPTIHRDPQAHRYFKNLQGNVVILGGYRGSILRDSETHQMMWVPLKVGVGIRRPTLELGLTSEAEDHSEDHVIADEMLAGISSMVDMGRRLIHRCSSKRTKVHSWGYDWRLGLGRSSKRLEKFLLELWTQSAEKEQDRKGAKVVAHSMGGLVALHALATTNRPEIFDNLVFASTPFLGTANILGPFRFGDAALFNDEICSPRATFSFRSSFYLLPVDPSTEEGDKIENDTRGGRCFEEEDGTVHDLDFLDPETWNEFGFSPCVAPGKRQEVLKKSKERAKMQGRSLHGQLERSASIRQDQGITRPKLDQSDSKANIVPSLPGPDIGLVSSNETENNTPSSGMMNMATSSVFEAAKAGHSLLEGTVSNPKEEESTLQPANRQDQSLQLQNTLSQEEWTEVMEDEESASWLYLERTLAETRLFFKELRTSFSESLFVQGRYPPMAILTSGRTPTVRGALVNPTSNPGDPEGWKQTAREGDYSRMLYAPGDGVILRRSSTTLPGQWGNLLVRGEEDDEEALTNYEGVVETSHRHVTLLSDVDGIGRCLEACRRAKRKAQK